jgi:hypothetical protein
LQNNCTASVFFSSFTFLHTKLLRCDVFLDNCPGRDAQVFRNSRSHLRILSVRRGTQNKFHTKDPKILGATITGAQDLCTPVLNI